MRKKILATLMLVGLLAAQTLSVCAAPSNSTGVSTPTTGYVVTDADAVYKDAEKDLTKLTASAADSVKDAVKGKKALTPVFDLKALDGTQKVDGYHVVTLKVPNLSGSMKDVTVLHFNGTAWEIVSSTVDYNQKTVTAKFTDLSPVVIIARESSDNGSSGSSSGSSSSSSSSSSAAAASPKTGVASDWAMWIGAAVVLGAASVALKKKEA